MPKETLTRLRAVAGDRLPTAELTPEFYERVMAHWDQRAANTWNKHLSRSTRSAHTRTGKSGWLFDPARRLERRKGGLKWSVRRKPRFPCGSGSCASLVG